MSTAHARCKPCAIEVKFNEISQHGVFRFFLTDSQAKHNRKKKKHAQQHHRFNI